MEVTLKTQEIPAHWFSGKEEMHEILDEWMMAWIRTKQYDGMEVRCACQVFILYTYLQQSIRHATLVE
jgi:hypothetical protein